jgi:hypothetical protein
MRFLRFSSDEACQQPPTSAAPLDPRLQRSRGRRSSERGALLVVVMLLMLALLGLGLTGLWLTSGNLQVSANINQRLAALYVAEAGVERARFLLNGGADVAALLRGSTPGSDDVPTGLDATGVPNGAGAIMMDGALRMLGVAWPPASFGRSAGSLTAPVATTMGTYTVWVRNDTADCRNGLYTVDSNGTVVVRSLGLAPDGLTQVVLEVALGAFPSSKASPPPSDSGDYYGKNGNSSNTNTLDNTNAP